MPELAESYPERLVLPDDVTRRGFKLMVRADTRMVVTKRSGKVERVERSGLRMWAVGYGCTDAHETLEAVVTEARALIRYFDWRTQKERDEAARG